MKVFISRIIPEIATRLIKEAGHSITQFTERRDLLFEELVNICKQHDAFLSVSHNKLNKEFLSQCTNLKVISLFSVGYDHLDVQEATRLKIPVGNTPNVLSNATADTAFLLMLAVSRKAIYLHKTIAKAEWGYYDPVANLGIELYGKTLGIFGLGKIGYELAQRCKGAYNMKLLYYNRGANREAEKELGAVKVSFDELLKQSDILTVHSALTDETREIFDKKAFSKMKPTSIFINTARGGIHNELDLIEALKSGMIWGAGLDVTNPEPMNPNNVLLDMPNVAILPHIGSATIEAREGMARIAALNVIAGLKGERLPFPVNPEIY